MSMVGLGSLGPVDTGTAVSSGTGDAVAIIRVEGTITAGDDTHKTLDMLLAKKRASDRKSWLEKKGDLAEV